MLEQDKQRLRSIESNLNFNGLIELIERDNIKINFTKLNGPFGLATYFGVFVDIETILSGFPPDILFFTILHEIAHYKKIMGNPLDDLITILSNKDVDSFVEEVITEERFADRYASILFFKLNQKTYPNYWTQELEKEYKREKYKKEIIPLLFGKINNKDDYNNLVEKLLGSDSFKEFIC